MTSAVLATAGVHENKGRKMLKHTTKVHSLAKLQKTHAKMNNPIAQTWLKTKTKQHRALPAGFLQVAEIPELSASVEQSDRHESNKELHTMAKEGSDFVDYELPQEDELAEGGHHMPEFCERHFKRRNNIISQIKT